MVNKYGMLKALIKSHELVAAQTHRLIKQTTEWLRNVFHANDPMKMFDKHIFLSCVDVQFDGNVG